MSESAHLFPGMNSWLFQAADQGNVDVLNDLIESKKLNILQEFTGLGNSVLHIAISRGNLKFIERLLQLVDIESVAGREFLRARNTHGNIALHLAALYGHHELVEKFVGVMEGDVEAGNFLRFQNSQGNTALHEAAKEGNYKIVEILLSRDSGLSGVLNREGEMAVSIASQRGHILSVEALLRFMTPISNMEHGRHDDQIIVSNREGEAIVDSQSGHTEIMDSNTTSQHHGQTPLHAAVFCGHAGVVKKLLQHSPQLAKQTDGCGRTALHMLALSFPVPEFLWQVDWTSVPDFTEIARLLLEEENSLCYKECRKNQTPLHMAVEGAKYGLVEILLRYGRDCIEAVDNDGRKPLHLAVMNAIRLAGTFNIAEFHLFKNMLLSLMSKESLNHRDNTGRTPLHIAVEYTEKDPLLYGGIKSVLRINGALLSPEILEISRGKEPLTGKLVIKGKDTSITAVLIATVSFAAVFTLPGGLDSQQKALLINTHLFKLFLICDAFSFCSSIASAVLVQYACAGEKEDLYLGVYSVYLLWAALISLVVAFGAAVNLVIAPSSLLVGIVWTFVCLVPITINVRKFLFRAFRM